MSGSAWVAEYSMKKPYTTKASVAPNRIQSKLRRYRPIEKPKTGRRSRATLSTVTGWLIATPPLFQAHDIAQAGVLDVEIRLHNVADHRGRDPGTVTALLYQSHHHYLGHFVRVRGRVPHEP